MPNIPIQQLPYRAEAPADWLKPVADLYTKYQFELKPKQEALQRATALEQLKQLLEQAKFDEDKRKNLAGETQTAAFQTETNNLAREKFDWSKGDPTIVAAGSNVLTRQSPDAGGAGMPPPSSGAMTDSFGQSTPQTPWDYMTQTGLGRGTPTLPPMAAQTAPTAAPTVPGYNVTTFPKEPQPYNLLPGQQRRDASNNVVASVPLTPSQQHVPGSDTKPETTAKPEPVRNDLGDIIGWTSWDKKRNQWVPAPDPSTAIQPKPKYYNPQELTKGADFLSRSGNTEADLRAKGWSEEAIAQAKAGMQKKTAAPARVTGNPTANNKSSGWRGPGYYMVRGKKTPVKTAQEYRQWLGR